MDLMPTATGAREYAEGVTRLDRATWVDHPNRQSVLPGRRIPGQRPEPPCVGSHPGGKGCGLPGSGVDLNFYAADSGVLMPGAACHDSWS